MTDYKVEAESIIDRMVNDQTGHFDVTKAIVTALEVAEKRGRVAGLREAADLEVPSKHWAFPGGTPDGDEDGLREAIRRRAEEIEGARV